MVTTRKMPRIIGNAFPVPFGIVNKLFYDDKETSKYHYKQQSDADAEAQEKMDKIKDGQIGGGDSDSSKLILIMAIASIPGVITYKTFEPIIKSNSTWLYNWIQSQLNSSTNNSTNSTGGFNGSI